MTVNLNNLRDLPIEDLRVIAAQHNIPVHHKHAKESLVDMIINKVTTPPPAQPQKEMQHKGEHPMKPVHNNTPLDVEEAIARIKAKCQEKGYEFKSDYDLEEGTWTFNCLGAEECGNLAIPLRIIREKAEHISKGARRPRAHDQREWGSISNGKNSYTNTILA